MNMVLANYTVSVTELKKNFSSILSETDEPIAVLNHNQAEAYLLPATYYEAMLAHLEDLEDMKLVLERASEKTIEVSIDEL